MFTGIIEEMGIVEQLSRRAEVQVTRIRIATAAGGLAGGDSIAVNGCCLTAVDVAENAFTCELTPETLRRTAFESRLQVGALVNLERPLRAGGRLDGHIVQGHVDGVGRVSAALRLGESAEVAFEAPAELLRYLVLKGSVAVDGISLTVARLEPPIFTVAVIPYTLEHTTLGKAAAGDRVNLEMDVIAKYVERLLEPHLAGAR